MNIMSSSNGRPFGPRGCQVPVGRGVCGETKTLDIINEFKRLYEEKMKEIDTFGGGDNLELKMRLQQEWIKDLSEQNELLVKAVEELECEATERVLVLEDKLQQSAKCICEEQENNKTKERLIQDLQQKLNKFHSYGDIDALKTELTCKKEECESLKQSMVEMRQVLTEEVAQKHDMLIQLKREYQELEERCIQSDKQTAFRDDIIKELRKEIKQLKQQIPEKPFPNSLLPENALKTDSKGETYLVLNHTKKIVQSGKSTVIYLRQDKTVNDRTETKEEHSKSCSKCKKSLERKEKGNNEQVSLLFSKSENNIFDYKKMLKPVNERSKLTNSFKRSHTFVESRSSDGKLNKEKILVPNHMPVKTFISNLESNK